MRSQISLLLALALLSPAVPRADQDIVPTGNHVAKLTLPIDTTYDDPGTMETVHVTGSLLVKTGIHYSPNSPIKVVTRFAVGRDVSAIGMTSGDPYTVKGKGALKYSWPPTPLKSVDHTGILVALPISPIAPPNPIRVHYRVEFDSTSGDVSGSLIDFPSNPIVNTCTAIAQVCN